MTLSNRVPTVPRVDVTLGARSYPVHIGTDLLGDCGLWQASLPAGHTLIVTNDRVAPLYLERVSSAIGRPNITPLVLPDGEAHKNRDSWWRIQDELARVGALRDAVVVALGGGVIGDLAGFAAATWMRGIAVVQAPTTLLAQVDASVGGKTGFNHAAGKNLVGAFHQPRAVIADTATFETLPEREFRAGLAEVVKADLIDSPTGLDGLAADADALAGRDAETVTRTVARAVAFKARIVEQDEREGGLRMLLNLGHTFAHAIETVTDYDRYLHGEAVAIGLVMAADLSERLARCAPGLAERVEVTLRDLGLPVTIPAALDADALLEAMRLDKKAQSDGWRFVLLNGPGEASVVTCDDRDAIRATLEARRDRN